MKKLIIITSFLCGFTLKVLATIEPTNTSPFISFFNGLVTYTYDDAGNIIRKSYNRILTTSETIGENFDMYSAKGDFDISIKADYPWEHINIDVTGPIDANGALLEVYNTSGMNVYKASMESNHSSINLSQLNKGIYLFRITIGESIKTCKLIKH